MADFEEDGRALSDPRDQSPADDRAPGGESVRDVTRLLLDWRRGDRAALERLMPLVYDELRLQAARYLRAEPDGLTLQTQDLVHEAYLRLVDQGRVDWVNRAHFFGVAATMMRRILVDHARRRSYAKRGGGAQRISLDESLLAAGGRDPDLVALDDALADMEAMDPELAKIVELRFFGGLKGKEIAHVLGLSTPTVSRRWRVAKAWLYDRLAAEGRDEP